MFYLTVMLLFFILSVFIHIVICRNRKLKGLWVKLFCMIAAVNLFLCWGIFLLLGRSIALNAASIWGLPLSMTSTFIYILLVPTYTIFYVSTQLNSPSKKVLLLLKKNGAMTFQELLNHFTEEEFIIPRIMDLQKTGCIQCAQRNWRLTPPGLTIAKFLNFYQSILGRQAGG